MSAVVGEAYVIVIVVIPWTPINLRRMDDKVHVDRIRGCAHVVHFNHGVSDISSRYFPLLLIFPYGWPSLTLTFVCRLSLPHLYHNPASQSRYDRLLILH